jgi:hypothetical protein
MQLLKPQGALSFITSNKWYRAAYGKALRTYLRSHARLLSIIDFGDEAVFTALAYPTIVIAQKRDVPLNPPPDADEVLALNWDKEQSVERFPLVFAEGAFAVPQRELKVEGWHLEQPVKTIAELAELRLKLKLFNIKVAADESVRKSSDPLAVELAGAADILVLKSAPLGGIASALQIAASSKLPIVPSSAMQSSIGLGAELHFAACLDELTFDAGLGTMNLFAGDLVTDSLKPVDGVLEVRRPEVATSALETLKAEDHRYDWWIARLQRCGRLIGLEG